MNMLVRFLLFLLLLGFHPAVAQESAQEPEYGVGLLCDTQEQTERFVRDFTTTEATLALINAEAPGACGIGHVAFYRGKEVSVVRNRQGSYSVVEIMVIAGVTPYGLRPVPPTKQYTLLPSQEEKA